MHPVNGTSTDDPFWCRGAAELMSELGSAPSGLSAEEAARRLHDQGRNMIAERVHNRLLGKIVHRLADPLIAILAVAAAVSGISGDWASCIIILAILAISIGLEIIQEQKAETIAEALKRSVAVHAAVRRDGKTAQFPSRKSSPATWSNLAPAISCLPTASCWKPTARRRTNRC